MDFGRPADHAAAEQQRVQHERLRRVLRRHREGEADDAVLREAVVQLEGLADRGRRGHQLPDVVQRAADEGQVELVRLLRELRRPLERARVHVAHTGAHLERAPEVLQRDGRRTQLLRLGPGRIGLPAGDVLHRERRQLEAEARRERPHELRGRNVERHRLHVRKRCGDLGALGRIVVDENERVEAEPESLSDLGELLGLPAPVRDEGGEVGQPEPHPRVPLERRPRGLRVVLGGDREKNAPAGQGQKVLLERRIGLAVGSRADRDPVGPFLADQTSPEGVVEVDDEAAGPEPEVSRQHGRRLAGEQRQRRIGEGLTRRMPHSRLEPALLADPGREPLAVDEQDGAPRRGAEPLVQPADERDPAPGKAHRQVAERGLVRCDEPMLDDARAEAAADPVPEPAPTGLLGVESRVGIVRELREVELRGGRCDEHVRRLEARQAAAGVEHLLLELSVGRGVDRRVDPERTTRELELGDQLSSLVAAEDTEPDLPHGRRRPARRGPALEQVSRHVPRARIVAAEQERAEELPGVVVAPFADERANGRARDLCSCR